MYYGIKNAYYSINGNIPIRLPGAVSLTTDSNGEILTKKIRLNSGIIVEKPVGVTESSEKIAFEIADLPINFLVDIFGYEVDGAGVLIEHQQRKAIPFSLLFETSNKDDKCRAVYYECYCRKPQCSIATNSDSVKLSARSLDIIATGDPISAMITRHTSKSVYNNWFNTVYR